MEHTQPEEAVAEDEELVHVDASFEPLVPKFMTNRKKEVVVMQEALTAKDFDTVRKVAHGMKGAGGSYGFDRITEIDTHIEQAATAGNTSPIARDLPALSSYLDRIKVVYD
ncbi:MAG: Hpt domain-containing protein [Nitrospira sp.]